MDIKQTLEYFLEAEETAAKILAHKEEILNLHRRLNETREALAVVTKSNIQKTFAYNGSLLVKQSRDEIIIRLKKDFQDLNAEIKTKGDDMKQLVYRLQDIEKQQPFVGKDLVPLNKDELSALSQVWGRHV